MAIEAKGAKCAYAAFLHAIATELRLDGNLIHHAYSTVFLAADSDDEAFGIATRIASKIFPAVNGWHYRSAHLARISGIDWVGRYDESKNEPQPRPW